MLPLSFREFIKVFSPELYEIIPRIEKIEKEEIFKKAYETLPIFNEIEELFEKYLKVGGFPLAVKSEGITEDVKDAYWSWLKNDLAKIERSEETFKRIAKAIVEKAPSAISLNSIAKEFEIATHKTVFEYLNIMEKLFVAKILYYFDLGKEMPSFRKKRKVCFMDPFFFNLFADVCLTRLPNESIIVENVVASHLARKFEVFYWKNKREIDIVARENGLIGFEVKWTEEAEDYSKIKIGKLKDIFCLTKNKLDREKNLLPISIFLAML
jgi:predicted AAA+ superfamily ATPase